METAFRCKGPSPPLAIVAAPSYLERWSRVREGQQCPDSASGSLGNGGSCQGIRANGECFEMPGSLEAALLDSWDPSLR